MEVITGWIQGFGEWLLNGIKDALIGLLEWILIGIIDNSYWFCLMICMIGMFLYIGGLKRAGKWVGGSFVVYLLLQSLGMALRC